MVWVRALVVAQVMDRVRECSTVMVRAWDRVRASIIIMLQTAMMVTVGVAVVWV